MNIKEQWAKDVLEHGAKAHELYLQKRYAAPKEPGGVFIEKITPIVNNCTVDFLINRGAIIYRKVI